MTPESVRTNAQIGKFMKKVGADVQILGTSSFDEPIWLAKTGGTKQPAIVITAGSHADEVAGVFAALHFVQSLASDHAIYIVPCRDPNGWNGFSATLQRVRPGTPAVTSHVEAAAELRTADVYFDDGSLVIAQVGSTVFATQPTTDWTSTQITRHALPALLADDPTLASRMRETRVIVPGNVAVDDGRNPYSYGGHTAYVGDGYVAQFNRFFDRPDAPVEVATVRTLVDQVRPGLTLDLHEGFADGYYLFIHSAHSAPLIEMARVMISAVRTAGGRIATRAELEPVWGAKTAAGIHTIDEGVFTLGPPSAGQRSSFAGYCEQFGVALTTEPGMEATVAERVSMIETGVRAVIERFTARHRQPTGGVQ
jgi:hypothetical protein